ESYRMIAALGEHQALRIAADAPEMDAHRLLDRGTCLAIFHMLEQPLPDGWDARLGATLDTAHRRVAWKTGTSPGNRDAWAFVFDAEYLVGVWMGNNSGRASQRLVGAHAALPLAAAIVRSLPPPSADAWPAPGNDLRPVTVCAASGLPATQWSTATRTALVPARAVLNRRCDVFGPDGSGGVVAQWPSGPRNWDLARIETAVPGPAHTHAPDTPRLAILEPPPDAQFVLVNQSGADRVHLRASLSDTQPLHWFVNGI